MSGQLHALAALPPANESSVPIDYAAGWKPVPILSFFRKDISLLPLSGIEPRIVQAIGCNNVTKSVQNTIDKKTGHRRNGDIQFRLSHLPPGRRGIRNNKMAEWQLLGYVRTYRGRVNYTVLNRLLDNIILILMNKFN
jgi:hypothetical protein